MILRLLMLCGLLAALPATAAVGQPSDKPLEKSAKAEETQHH